MLIKNSFTVKKLSELPYLDTTLDLESRTEDLLQRLTFEEKCLLIVGEKGGHGNITPPIPRLRDSTV